MKHAKMPIFEVYIGVMMHYLKKVFSFFSSKKEEIVNNRIVGDYMVVAQIDDELLAKLLISKLSPEQLVEMCDKLKLPRKTLHALAAMKKVGCGRLELICVNTCKLGKLEFKEEIKL